MRARARGIKGENEGVGMGAGAGVGVGTGVGVGVGAGVVSNASLQKKSPNPEISPGGTSYSCGRVLTID